MNKKWISCPAQMWKLRRYKAAEEQVHSGVLKNKSKWHNICWNDGKQKCVHDKQFGWFY